MYEKETKPEGPSGRQVGIGLSIPLWFRRPWGLYQSSKAHWLETNALSKTMQNMVNKMVHMEYTETITHLTLAQNYEKDILPTAQSNLKIARDQYASGRGDFLRVLEAHRAWIETQNEYQQEVYHTGEHFSLLERWVGIDLSKAKDLLTESSSDLKENSHAH
jgi:outer membrane protein TolC